MIHLPPKWADRILEWFCDPSLLEDLQGDLLELYERKTQKGKPLLAKWLYVWLVIRSLRLSAWKGSPKLKNSILMMTRNNFKIALRVLWKDRLNTSINLLGLTIGIACFLLLGLYVKQELSYDRFHSKSERIYRSWLREDYGEGRIFFNSQTPLRFESMFEENFPEVEEAVQYTEQTYLVGRGENRINEKVAIISPEFFEVFDFQILYGNKDQPIPSQDHLVISQQFADKYFGSSEPVGQNLAIQLGEDIRDFTISAVMADISEHSSIRFDLAISTDNNRSIFGERALTAWFSVAPETYVLLKEKGSIQSVTDKMQDVVLSLMGDVGYGDEAMKRDQYNIGFQKLTSIHLDPSIPLGYAPVMNPQYVYILGAVGFLVLIIACLNYTTLSIGQSIKRSREVGIRKVMGAVRKTLVYQYVSESILLAFIATIIATALTMVSIPAFNRLTGTAIHYQFEWWHSSVFLLIGIVIGMLSGIYPSLILSRLKIVSILAGSASSGGKFQARKGLLVFQFLVSLFLISTTLIMQKQVRFLKNKDLGYQYEAVISAQLNPDPSANGISNIISSGMANGALLKAELAKHPEISKIAMGSHVFGTPGWANLAYTDDENVFRRFRLLVVDANYLPSFGIELSAGRGFEEGNGLDQRQSILLNETAVDYFGLTDPVGKQLPGSDFGEHRIIGVTRDFHFSSLHSEVEPLVIVQNIMPIAQGVSDGDVVDSVVPKLVFTYSGSNLLEATAILQKEWEKVFPGEQWNYAFLDDRIKAQYAEEARTNRLIGIASVLSILIAVLGLLALTLLIVNSKVKEIGIRKVMGASLPAIFRMLYRSFSLQFIVAFILAVPLTLLLINRWMENFAYRTAIGLGPFIVSLGITLLITILIIGFYAIRASRINPVDSLRSE